MTSYAIQPRFEEKIIVKYDLRVIFAVDRTRAVCYSQGLSLRHRHHDFSGSWNMNSVTKTRPDPPRLSARAAVVDAGFPASGRPSRQWARSIWGERVLVSDASHRQNRGATELRGTDSSLQPHNRSTKREDLPDY